MFALIAFAVLIAFSTQSYQCAPPELQSARVKMQRADWEGAKADIYSLLETSPNNAEAWMDLAEVYYLQKRIDSSAIGVMKARKLAEDPNLKERIKRFEYPIWAGLYGAIFTNLQKGFAEKNDIFLNKAVSMAELAIELSPKQPEPYRLAGQACLIKEDKDCAINFYEQYADVLEPHLEFGYSKDLYLFMALDDAKKKLGKPEQSVGDTTKADLFLYDGKEFYLFSQMVDESGRLEDDNFEVVGWKYDPPEEWSDQERFQQWYFDLAPFVNLAQSYRDAEETDKALEFIKQIIMLDPANLRAVRVMTEIYGERENTQAAIDFAKELIAKRPSDMQTRLLYANVLFETENWEKSIKEYEKVLQMNPDNEEALINMGASLKNIAGQVQEKEIERVEALEKEGKSGEIDTDLYFPYLERSANYFQQAKNSEVFSRVAIYSEIVDIYDLLDAKQKLRDVMVELESMESDISKEEKPRYYLTLSRIYGKLKMTEKREEAVRKYKYSKGD